MLSIFENGLKAYYWSATPSCDACIQYLGKYFDANAWSYLSGQGKLDSSVVNISYLLLL